MPDSRRSGRRRGFGCGSSDFAVPPAFKTASRTTNRSSRLGSDGSRTAELWATRCVRSTSYSVRSIIEAQSNRYFVLGTMWWGPASKCYGRRSRWMMREHRASNEWRRTKNKSDCGAETVRSKEPAKFNRSRTPQFGPTAACRRVLPVRLKPAIRPGGEPGLTLRGHSVEQSRSVSAPALPRQL
jgi:hypothetical protein